MIKLKKKTLLIISFTIVSLLALATVLYFFYFQSDNTEQVDTEDDRYEELDDGYAIYNGEAIRAKLPSGWKIIEYFDGEEAPSLYDSMINYLGLTGIEISSSDERNVFSIQAVADIGLLGCPTYPEFEDSSQEHLEEKRAQSEELGDIFDVIDYKDSEYIEIDFLGTTIRRMGGQYFYDTKPGNEYFEPLCVERIITLEELNFTDEDGNIYQSYIYGPTEDSTEEDLLIIDDILESVEVLDR